MLFILFYTTWDNVWLRYGSIYDVCDTSPRLQRFPWGHICRGEQMMFISIGLSKFKTAFMQEVYIDDLKLMSIQAFRFDCCCLVKHLKISFFYRLQAGSSKLRSDDQSKFWFQIKLHEGKTNLVMKSFSIRYIFNHFSEKARDTRLSTSDRISCQ